MTEGEMIWYDGPGVYQDGVRICDLVDKEIFDLLTSHGYIVIRSHDNNEDKQDES